MCGIAGIIGASANQSTLENMLHHIKHRGEDNYANEHIIIENFAIGMNRLAIVDEDNGKQPFSFNENIYCVFNGEIYNYKKIREKLSRFFDFKTNCDTEVLIASYLHWGEDFLKELDGKFAFCIIDVRKNYFLLARDHVGIKPLYYAKYQNNWYFASEIKAFQELSFIEKIISLPPATLLTGEYKSKYYQIPEYSLGADTKEKMLEKIKFNLIEAVKKRIPKESKKIACLLSGGVDSSIILYLASKLHKNIEAFTFANPNDYSGDLENAKKLCDELNIPHIVVSPSKNELQKFYLEKGVYLTESYEPVLVRNAVSYHFLCKTVKKYSYKFVLNGEGADELFGGYDFFKEIPLDKRDQEIRQSLLNLHKTYLQMADRASMYTTLEARVPYMDKEFINYCMQMPSYFRINEDQNKWALREIFKTELPSYIVYRAKTGMNEGAGFGRNRPTEGIYYEAVKKFYEKNKNQQASDYSLVMKNSNRFTINLSSIEEIYNFARFSEYGFTRLENAHERIQLNTPLVLDLLSERVENGVIA